jgi:hypothetical protein
MPDYQAVFTANSRRRVVVFKANPTTKEQLERMAKDRLCSLTTIPVHNWELASLNRLVYLEESEQAG